MARGKNKPKLDKPTNVPYILFELSDGSFITSTSFDEAKRYHKHVKPASILNIIKKYGHAGANNILHQHAKSWVCKDGNIFIKEVTNV